MKIGSPDVATKKKKVGGTGPAEDDMEDDLLHLLAIPIPISRGASVSVTV